MAEAPKAQRGKGLKPVRIKSTFHYLRRFGFAPDVVIDVGVWDGTAWLYRAFPEARFVLIDPLEECRALVAANRPPATWEFHAVALGAQAGELDFTATIRPDGSGGNLSGFHARVDRSRNWVAETETRRVPVRTLDTIATGYPGSLGLKIDTEGHEDMVLAGAAQTLARCAFVIVEVSVSRRFDRTPLPSAIIAPLAAAGLELRDVLEMAPPDHDMPRHMDLLFTRWPQA